MIFFLNREGTRKRHGDVRVKERYFSKGTLILKFCDCFSFNPENDNGGTFYTHGTGSFLYGFQGLRVSGGDGRGLRILLGRGVRRVRKRLMHDRSRMPFDLLV
jgi:hypothetical protein